MTNTAIENLITSTLSDYGETALVILTAVIGVGVAMLAFNFGWNKIKTSMRIDAIDIWDDGRRPSQMDMDLAQWRSNFGKKGFKDF